MLWFTIALSWLKKIPYQIWLLIGLVVLFYGYGEVSYRAGKEVVQKEWDASKQRGQAIVDQLKKDATTINTVIDTETAARTEYIYVKGDTIIKQIPVYIPAGTPDLPAGYRVLHDAAATSTVPGRPEDIEAAPVRVEDATKTTVENYTTCLVWREEVVAWRKWYAEQSQLWQTAEHK